MKKSILLLILAMILVLGIALYRWHGSSGLDVTPDAREQIERAKHR